MNRPDGGNTPPPPRGARPGVNIDMALVAYLVPLVGSGIILLTSRDPFARYHARQALLLPLVAVGGLVGWLVVSWLLLWLPYGGVVAVLLFGLVLGLYLGLVVAWLGGIRNALQGKARPIPLYGRLIPSWA